MFDIRDKLGALKEVVNITVNGFTAVCLWFSGGSDSRLLLEVMREIGKPFAILRFEEGLSSAQRQTINKTIIEESLQVYSYPPAVMMLIGDDTNISLVSFYNVSGPNSAKVIRDLVDGTDCYFDVVPETTPVWGAPQEFPAHVWGSRFDDKHWALPDGMIASSDWLIGGRYFVAPLADWTREEVVEALAVYGVEWQEVPEVLDTGNIVACHACLKGEGRVFCPKVGEEIDSVVWPRQENLALFQSTFSNFATGE